eukprot:scaffold91769_cov21-Tisochrysis_lutea.AAC.1
MRMCQPAQRFCGLLVVNSLKGTVQSPAHTHTCTYTCTQVFADADGTLAALEAKAKADPTCKLELLKALQILPPFQKMLSSTEHGEGAVQWHEGRATGGTAQAQCAQLQDGEYWMSVAPPCQRAPVTALTLGCKVVSACACLTGLVEVEVRWGAGDSLDTPSKPAKLNRHGSISSPLA